MKKFLPFYILLIICLASCKSNEEKALALIDKSMFSSLFDYASYEPIEIVVKEGSSSIYTDSLIRKYALMAETSRKLYAESKEKANDALEYAEIYSGAYSYSTKRKFDDYMKQAKDEASNMEKYLSAWSAYEDSIKLQVSKFQPQKIGWEVTHKFRCKTKGGNFTLGNYVYLMDAKFSKIMEQFDMDDEDESSIRQRIDLAIKED